jgi:hypothetical protein
LVKDSDFDEVCFSAENRANYFARNPWNSDASERKTLGNRGDWAKCLPAPSFGIMCIHAEAHGLNPSELSSSRRRTNLYQDSQKEDLSSTAHKGQLHDWPAGVLYETLLDLHDSFCAHVELDLTDFAKAAFNDYMQGVGDFAWPEPEPESESESETEPEPEPEPESEAETNAKIAAFRNCSNVNYPSISSRRERLRKSLYCAMATIPDYETLPGNCGKYKMVKLTLDVNNSVVNVQGRAAPRTESGHDYNRLGDYEMCDGKELTPPGADTYIRLDGSSLAPDAHCSAGSRIGDHPWNPCLMQLERRTLEEAEAACESQGGRLANFQSVEDVQALQDFVGGQRLGIGLRRSGSSGWSFHGNATLPSSSFLHQLFGSTYESATCARLLPSSSNGAVLQPLNQKFCQQHKRTWICEGTSENSLTEGVVARGDLKADEGAFCLWHLPKEELHDYLPNDEGGFSNTDLACRLQTGSALKRECEFSPSSRRRGLVSRRGHYSNAQNFPVMGSDVGLTGVRANVSFLNSDTAYDAFHCHYTPENTGLLRMYAMQHMYERNYPGALRRTCGCGYKFLKNLVSRCDCTRNGVRSNNCARWHRDSLRRATEPSPVRCNNCNSNTKV